MNIKNNSRYKANSEKIETAFLTLILNHKYEDITISDICKQADVNRSTFYCHYDDINDLIIKIEGKFANSMAGIFNFGERVFYTIIAQRKPTLKFIKTLEHINRFIGRFFNVIFSNKML